MGRHQFEQEITQQQEVAELIDTENLNDLVVYNDDVNTFEHVINTLMKICKHTAEQAEQCTLLIHYKGKCAVKKGAFKDLIPFRQGIVDQGISAEIE